MVMGILGVSAAPEYVNMSVIDIQLSLKDVVQPYDIVHLGVDGVLRVFCTVNFTVQHSIPLTTSQIAEYVGSDDKDTPSSFSGVNGWNVPESKLLTPDDHIVTEVKVSLEKTRKEIASLPKPDSHLVKRPMLPCRSYLCEFTFTCHANCCLYCSISGGGLGQCIAPYC
ncbi:MAG: hypothetical protein M1839_003094 [Geoglossum umbratile]|nr:MAG: hypothetical protein M1839_003094 [Geoglossum umbratile]